MKRLSSIYLPLGIGLLLSLALAPGCTTHGEGGRCDPHNVNQTTGAFADCDNGLVCTSGSLLALPDGGGTSQTDICCPVDRSQATTDICRGSPVSPGSDASIPEGGFDTGTNDATQDQTTTDVTSDSPSDAPTESSTDAAGD